MKLEQIYDLYVLYVNDLQNGIGNDSAGGNHLGLSMSLNEFRRFWHNLSKSPAELERWIARLQSGYADDSASMLRESELQFRNSRAA